MSEKDVVKVPLVIYIHGVRHVVGETEIYGKQMSVSLGVEIANEVIELLAGWPEKAQFMLDFPQGPIAYRPPPMEIIDKRNLEEKMDPPRLSLEETYYKGIVPAPYLWNHDTQPLLNWEDLRDRLLFNDQMLYDEAREDIQVKKDRLKHYVYPDDPKLEGIVTNEMINDAIHKIRLNTDSPQDIPSPNEVSLSSDNEGRAVLIQNCTCPWNNGYLHPGGIQGHHKDCPSLKKKHTPDDACLMDHRDEDLD
jgi:hypothetical protein